jgi:hypothetical protein
MWLRRFTAMLLTVMLFSSMRGQTAQAQAQSSTSAFTVPPGGRVQVTFVAFCIDFNTGSFPWAIQAPNANNNPAIASEAVQKALIYIKNNKLDADPQKALEAQYAIWRLADQKGSPQGSTLADKIISDSKNLAITPPANARSILDKAGWNNKEWDLDTISWDPLSKPVKLFDNAYDRFYARGQMIVKNNTSRQLSLYMPDGTIIWPAGYSAHQRVAAYLTGVTVVIMPKTAGVNMPLVFAVFTSGLAVGVHLWRTRRQALWFSRAA